MYNFVDKFDIIAVKVVLNLKKYIFEVEGKAVPQGRPRFTSRGGFPRAYDPKSSRDYKNHIAFEVSRRIHERGLSDIFPFSGAGMLEVLEIRAVPSSWSAKKRDEALCGRIRATKKPDSSNVLKTVEDALNGILWKDDSQLIRSAGGKVYGAEPRIIITVSDLGS